LKIGREEDAIKVLINSCKDVTEAVTFALALNINDK